MVRSVVSVTARVITDDTGQSVELPVVITEAGCYQPLLEYFIYKLHSRSSSWRRDVAQSLVLLFRYFDANPDCFDTPSQLLSNFSNKLITGTIDEKGYDSSNLYWLPTRKKLVGSIVRGLSNFSSFLIERNYSINELNPPIFGDSFDKKMSYFSWFHKKKNNFLSHLDRGSPSRSRMVTIGYSDLKIESSSPIHFNEDLFLEFLCDGFGKRRDRRCAVRDQLILLMMHGAGLRVSEPFHLWVHDVQAGGLECDSTIVRVFHPSEGKAPKDFLNPYGNLSRSSYLQRFYAIKPRNWESGKSRVGWKGVVVDSPDNYIQLRWFPSVFGELFSELWQEHLFYLAQIKRHHPLAFITYTDKFIGTPYSLQAFKKNYNNALRRIGLSPSKSGGASPHAHRHSYGRRLAEADVDPKVIRRALHHANLDSQTPYTAPSNDLVSQELSEATNRLNKSVFKSSSELINFYNNRY